MNFMSSRGGFYEEITTGSTSTSTTMVQSRGFGDNISTTMSSSSSPSTFLQHKSLHLYNHHNHQEPHRGGGGGDDSDDYMLIRRAGGGDSSSSTVIEKEHMFDKVVTPSDVGKLNRLVIPKQHAERYFPLDSSSNEKGLLLNFEDRNGKPWRFRYSYWNSSQSYVMTKGWSRFVKEKKLEAGDIVSFQRGAGEPAKDRLFIDWRRRPDAPDLPRSIPHQFSWNPLFLHPPRDYYSSQMHQLCGYGGPNYGFNSSNVVNGNPCPPGSIMYLRPRAAGGGGGGGGGVYAPQEWGPVHAHNGINHHAQMVYESVPVVQGKVAAKRLRLFGVNMDCPISDSDHDQCDQSTMPLTHHMNSGLMPPPTSNFGSSNSPYSSPIPYLQLGLNYNDQSDDEKGKGSMSLDLDI